MQQEVLMAYREGRNVMKQSYIRISNPSERHRAARATARRILEHINDLYGRDGIKPRVRTFFSIRISFHKGLFYSVVEFL